MGEELVTSTPGRVLIPLTDFEDLDLYVSCQNHHDSC